jgi:hypothetical protein
MKTMRTVIIRRLALLFFCFLPAILYGGQQYGTTTGSPPSNPPSYAASEGNAPQQKNLQHIARKEYKVCLEHCANDAECTARCAQAYSRRMKSFGAETN